MKKTYDCIILGGMAEDSMGRPLGLYRLRTALRNKGYESLVVDCGWALDYQEMFDLLEAVITTETAFIGLSSVWFRGSTVGSRYKATGVNKWYCNDFFAQVKEKWPWIKIVMGGSQSAPNMTDIHIDYIVSGYADDSIIVLLEYIKGIGPRPVMMPVKYSYGRSAQYIDSDAFYKVENIDETETVFEASDGWKPWQPIPLQASRGCVFQCAFCTHPFLGQKGFDYIRSPESIASEMRRNYELFGTTRYLLMDDTLNDSVEKLQRLLKARELSKLPSFEMCAFVRPELLVTKPEMVPLLGELGLVGGFVGLESLGKEARRAIGKGMDVEKILPILAKMHSDYGVQWQTGMIVGLPGDSGEDVMGYYEKLKNDGILYGWSFTPLAINQGTLIGKDPAKYGYTIKDGKWTNNVGLTLDQAVEVAKAIGLRGIQDRSVRPAGWEVGAFWYHKASPESLKRSLSSFQYRKVGALTGRERALSFVKRIKKEQSDSAQ